MLRPSQLYKDEINKKFIDIWYDTSYQWYAMDCGLAYFDPAETNHDTHSFVSVDENGRILGFICYSVNWEVMSAHSLGIMAFEKFNLTFGRDLRQAIEDIFFKYNMNRLSFFSIADNPVVPTYKRFTEKYGGRICGYERDTTKLIDGKLHDTIRFEIMAEDFKSNYGDIRIRKEAGMI